MILRRPLWLAVVAALVLGLPGCEPYMSMTDQMSRQTRRATAVLPQTPRYVGMVDMETALGQLGELTGRSPADSVRETDNPRLRAFLDATGLDPTTDLRALYGALEADDTVSGVLFASVTPEEMDAFLDQAPSGTGRATEYRQVPLYHLALNPHTDAEHGPNSLSTAFLGDGMWALSSDADRLRDMVDRHETETEGFRANEDYMALVKRVGHGSTAWLVGRDVLDSALPGDSTSKAASSSGSVADGAQANQAGVQSMLSAWSDRVLGLSSTGSLDGGVGSKVERLKSQIREQAVSLTLTDAAVDGQLYLTMHDEDSASDVIDITRGVLAALRISKDELSDRHRDLLDGVSIEREGPVVHVQFSLARDHLRRAARATRVRHPTDRREPSIRRANPPTHRMTDISRPDWTLNVVRLFLKSATSLPKGLSTAVQ